MLRLLLVSVFLFFMSCSGDLDYIDPVDRLSYGGGIAGSSSSNSDGDSNPSCTVNSPYPQKKSYGNNTINVSDEQASDKLKTKFNNFIERFYGEGNCRGIPCASIEIPIEGMENTYATSQSIGHAMIMMVYFSDCSKSYQKEFDKLWNFYKHWHNNNELMSSEVPGYYGDLPPAEPYSASDADLDVAVALAMAGKQFKDAKYIDYAKELIAKIREFEIVSSTLFLKGNDAPIDNINIYYISPAAFQIFQTLVPNQNWSQVLNKNYEMLSQALHALQPNSNTYIDDLRIYWRLAWANAWFDEQKNELTKFANASILNTPCTGRSYCISVQMSASTVNSQYQNQLNNYWSALQSTYNNDNYYDHAMQILAGLLVTGNMPNLLDP